MEHLLTFIIFIPTIGALFLLLIPEKKEKIIKITATAISFIPLLLSLPLLLRFDSSTSAFQFVEKYNWIPMFNIKYYVAVDGISITMVILTTLLSFLSVIASFGINKSLKGYFSLFLLLETGMLGTFCALDFFLFYIFWELMLLPMYFLIGIWGGPRKEYAAIKFFLYTLLGSVFMLIVMIVMYLKTGSFDLTELPKFKFSFFFQCIAFIFLYIAFAIKVPVFPFHTWLPDAHVEAPTAISVILAGILLKMGIYGFMRISFPILPHAAIYFAFPFAVLGVINIIYGALCSMGQTDFKRLVAYSSVSHMGYCLLGMASLNQAGMNGALLQMFNHGTITGMLFLIVGVVYDRVHHRDINGFGGLATQMPIYSGITSLAMFASLGLPGLSGFISEVLVLFGGFAKFRVLTVLASTGIVLTAGYFLWTIERMFLGKPNPKYNQIEEINARELFTLIPLLIIVIFVGIYPTAILKLMDISLLNLISMVK
ncbi:MAG: NADH-quinone oxidoreductase subunit M [Candidatus Hydrogenedentota bacterium]